MHNIKAAPLTETITDLILLTVPTKMTDVHRKKCNTRSGSPVLPPWASAPFSDGDNAKCSYKSADPQRASKGFLHIRNPQPWPKQDFKKEEEEESTMSQKWYRKMVKNLSIRVGEMTQWLKRLATHVEDMGSVPTTVSDGIQSCLSPIQENLMPCSCESSVCERWSSIHSITPQHLVFLPLSPHCFHCCWEGCVLCGYLEPSIGLNTTLPFPLLCST